MKTLCLGDDQARPSISFSLSLLSSRTISSGRNLGNRVLSPSKFETELPREIEIEADKRQKCCEYLNFDFHILEAFSDVQEGKNRRHIKFLTVVLLQRPLQ